MGIGDKDFFSLVQSIGSQELWDNFLLISVSVQTKVYVLKAVFFQETIITPI